MAVEAARAAGREIKLAACADEPAARPRRLGATARSFAILDHVAASQRPVDVLDIIASLKLPKATAYRLVEWFVSQGYLAREPGRKRLIVGPKLAKLAFGALAASMHNG
ncbi:MAG: helix-turn-helix domain-containing protein, partial [Pseudomonadota bacterium]